MGRRPAGRRGVLIALCALVLLASGCRLAQGYISTVRSLQRAGFSGARVQTHGPHGFVVTVVKDTEDLESAARQAAEVVWRKLPLRIERLEVVCDNGFSGKATFIADRAELERRFGARDPDLDRGFQQKDLRSVLIVVGVLALVGLAVLAGIIVLIVVLVRRNRGRRPPPGPPPGAWGPGYSAQPPPPGYRR